ncbi:SDR family NAD(P)-dependent oxidoreductase [bacterium]|nr:MAG: SDR family NAD(P)-dependent oxidoreductase [bacterium]
MGIKLKALRDQTIVITGASSGIGLATAKMAAKEGANVVLVSRNEAILRQIHKGSLIAVAHLKGKGGAIINLGSVESDISIPLQGMYAASKHAVKGYTDALRMELEEEGAGISVTLIKPSALDTPFPQNARNYLDEEPKLPPPVYNPEDAAMAIVHAAAHPKRDIYIGAGGKMFSSLNKHLPGVIETYNERIIVRQQTRGEAPRNPEGALHQPNVGGRVRGDHPGFVMPRSIYTRASLHPVFTGVVLAAAGLAVAAWFARDKIDSYLS